MNHENPCEQKQGFFVMLEAVPPTPIKNDAAILAGSRAAGA
jgi:hypothetical protein